MADYNPILLDNILIFLSTKNTESKNNLAYYSNKELASEFNEDADIIKAYLDFLEDNYEVQSMKLEPGVLHYKIEPNGKLKIKNGGYKKLVEKQNQKALNDEKMFKLQIQNLQGQINDINKRRTFWDNSAKANKYFWIPIVLSFVALAISIYVAFF